jgi:hypothetical protein
MTKMIVFRGWDAQIGRPKNDCCHPKNNRCLGRLSKAQGKPLLDGGCNRASNVVYLALYRRREASAVKREAEEDWGRERLR